MSLKNFRKRALDEHHRQALEALFAAFTVDTDICRICNRPQGWMFGDNWHPSSGPCHAGICNICTWNCEHPFTVTGYIIKRNGGVQVRTRCLRCNREPRNSAPRRGSEYWDILLADLRDSSSCERCGSLDGVELHHYAPRNVFPDADQWATGYLCPECHRHWHRSMNGYAWTAKRALV